MREEQSNETRYQTPRVSLGVENEGYFIRADMPGVPKEGVEVKVENRRLVVIGKKSRHQGEPIHAESAGRDYRHEFELSNTVDTARLTAQFEDGVLTLHLPKREDAKPRRVEIN